MLAVFVRVEVLRYAVVLGPLLEDYVVGRRVCLGGLPKVVGQVHIVMEHAIFLLEAELGQEVGQHRLGTRHHDPLVERLDVRFPDFEVAEVHLVVANDRGLETVQ